MANPIFGSEIKFAIELTAEGFDMDTNDFDIEVVASKKSVKASKTSPDPDGNLVIFREPALPDGELTGDSSDSSSSEDIGVWYAIVNTEVLSPGAVNVIATAYIPDANAADGIRCEIAKKPLVTLDKP